MPKLKESLQNVEDHQKALKLAFLEKDGGYFSPHPLNLD